MILLWWCIINISKDYGGNMAYFIGGIIVFFSSMVQGATGFGFSLIALPLLGFIFDFKIVVPALVIYSIGLNIIVLTRIKFKPNWRDIALLSVFAISTIPLGVNMLLFVEQETLKVFVGALIIIISLIMMKGFQINLKNRVLAYSIAGIFSGVLNGAVSLSGPPIVVLLANENQDKNQFRGSLTLVFFLLNIVTVAMYWYRGLFQSPALGKMMILLPIMIIGTYMGIYLGNKVDEDKFKKAVLFLLLLMGILNFI